MPVEPLSVGKIEKYYLYPGGIFSSRIPHTVDTILGSCVSVFLWDPFMQFASINHFMLPACNKEGGPYYKYGNIAIPELVNRMLKMGSNKNNLKAKIFGGSETNRSNSSFNIGERNITVAKTILDNEKIPIISQSVGGSLGRKVIFYSASGEVFINLIRQEIKGIANSESDHFKQNLTGR